MLSLFDYEFMRNAFAAATIVAIVSGSIGYFLVLRGETFAGHALAHVGFPGATGAVLIGVSPFLGLTVFTLASMGLVAAIAYLTAQRPAAGEVPYLLFMGFYGLVFPAYAWAALAGRGRVNWRILALGILLAMPCYYVGFVGRQMVWLVPGLAIALVAGVISAKTLRRPQTA